MKKPKTKKRPPAIPPEVSPFLLYEAAVQSPKWQVDYLPQFHRHYLGREPLIMREDFCGSGAISREWVKKSPKHFAVGLDLDPAPLRYAEPSGRAELSDAQQRRLKFIRQDVMRPTRVKFDLISACNFSFYTFHERKTLLRYAKSVHSSLKARGTLFLEMMGGDGFMETLQEERKVQVPGIGSAKMLWEQHQYDPITAVSDFSIHFRLPRGEWMNDVFRYHWRLWGIRDVREILEEAGFKETVVLWGQLDENGEETGEFLPRMNADYQKAWIAYVVGVKK